MGIRKRKMIVLKDIKKTYYGKNIEINVLKGVDLIIYPGEFVCIYGSSGSGKSTLLNIVGLLDYATEGEYTLDGISIKSLNDKKMAEIRNQKIGFVFQAYHLIQEMNVLENIAIPLGYAGMSKKNRTVRAQELLNEFHMEGLEKKYPAQLSGGEQQRVSIMRAISNRPQILLADEPTGNLDETTTEEIIELLKQTAHELGKCVIVVTHSREVAQAADHILKLDHGTLL